MDGGMYLSADEKTFTNIWNMIVLGRIIKNNKQVQLSINDESSYSICNLFCGIR